ncbi:MAG: acylphosphatase [Lachnospiraceae bacterium]|nr:acylphosphatase [Lachnospiraceae bacterium]
MKNIVRKHMLVSGTVTAVGFRYRATYIAQNLGITGWVRNTWDDRVEMEVQGTQQMLTEMLARLNAQPYIEICNVEEELLPVEEKEYEFKVRY